MSRREKREKKDDNRSSFLDNPFGGAFDFNNDGKEDCSEQWIGINIVERARKKKEQEAKRAVSWRLNREDGTEYGVDPEDYETKEEYEEALAERLRREEESAEEK